MLRGARGAIVAQVAQDIDFFAGVLAGEAGKGIGDDVTVVKVGHGWVAAHIEP